MTERRPGRPSFAATSLPAGAELVKVDGPNGAPDNRGYSVMNKSGSCRTRVAWTETLSADMAGRRTRYFAAYCLPGGSVQLLYPTSETPGW